MYAKEESEEPFNVLQTYLNFNVNSSLTTTLGITNPATSTSTTHLSELNLLWGNPQGMIPIFPHATRTKCRSRIINLKGEVIKAFT